MFRFPSILPFCMYIKLERIVITNLEILSVPCFSSTLLTLILTTERVPITRKFMTSCFFFFCFLAFFTNFIILNSLHPLCVICWKVCHMCICQTMGGSWDILPWCSILFRASSSSFPFHPCIEQGRKRKSFRWFWHETQNLKRKIQV